MHISTAPNAFDIQIAQACRWLGLTHAAFDLGGARVVGCWPRRNVSMMRICPPQSGQGCLSVNGGSGSGSFRSSGFGTSPVMALILVMLRFLFALARMESPHWVVRVNC